MTDTNQLREELWRTLVGVSQGHLGPDEAMKEATSAANRHTLAVLDRLEKGCVRSHAASKGEPGIYRAVDFIDQERELIKKELGDE